MSIISSYIGKNASFLSSQFKKETGTTIKATAKTTYTCPSGYTQLNDKRVQKWRIKPLNKEHYLNLDKNQLVDKGKTKLQYEEKQTEYMLCKHRTCTLFKIFIRIVCKLKLLFIVIQYRFEIRQIR